MELDEEYKDHDIHVETFEVSRGQYQWRYVVDGANLKEGRDRPLASQVLVLHEGLAAAKASVDTWIKLQKGG